VADPEEIYQEVLTEEQGKGVTPAVAEGRAKAARLRAEHGSPHPKEPKWWPGAQPHLEGDGAGPTAEPAAAEAVEEAPAEAPADAPAPAEEPAPAEAPAPVAEAPAAAPAAEAPAPAPAAPAAPAEAPAPAAAPAAAAPAATAAPPTTPPTVTPDMRPPGVSHGVPTGTRLRPEDAVQTDAQFEGQQAVYERRRLIDEYIATEPTAQVPTGPRSGQWGLFLIYLVIVAGAILFVVNQEDTGEGGGGTGGEAPPGGGGLTVTAQNVAFDTDTLELPADKDAEIEFVNDDASSVTHNIAIYEDDSASKEIFKGQVIPGGDSITYEVPSTPKGTYYFQCDIHPGMNGTVEVG
jgi:plastocyanin